jgi:choline dehydrogenase-like flavoprotein
VERVVSVLSHPTEGHILGTTVMGADPRESVVDRHLIHHRVRNLLVLGGSAFPTSSPANPTLTIAALSLWAAARG